MGIILSVVLFLFFSVGISTARKIHLKLVNEQIDGSLEHMDISTQEREKLLNKNAFLLTPKIQKILIVLSVILFLFSIPIHYMSF